MRQKRIISSEKQVERAKKIFISFSIKNIIYYVLVLVYALCSNHIAKIYNK